MSRQTTISLLLFSSWFFSLPGSAAVISDSVLEEHKRVDSAQINLLFTDPSTNLVSLSGQTVFFSVQSPLQRLGAKSARDSITIEADLAEAYWIKRTLDSPELVVQELGDQFAALIRQSNALDRSDPALPVASLRTFVFDLNVGDVKLTAFYALERNLDFLMHLLLRVFANSRPEKIESIRDINYDYLSKQEMIDGYSKRRKSRRLYVTKIWHAEKFHNPLRRSLLRMFWERLKTHGFDLPDSEENKKTWLTQAIQGRLDAATLLASPQKTQAELERLVARFENAKYLLSEHPTEKAVLSGIQERLEKTLSTRPGGLKHWLRNHQAQWAQKAVEQILSAKRAIYEANQKLKLAQFGIEIANFIDSRRPADANDVFRIFYYLSPADSFTRSLLLEAGVGILGIARISELYDRAKILKSDLTVSTQFVPVLPVSKDHPVGVYALKTRLSFNSPNEAKVIHEFETHFDTRNADENAILKERRWLFSWMNHLELLPRPQPESCSDVLEQAR